MIMTRLASFLTTVTLLSLPLAFTDAASVPTALQTRASNPELSKRMTNQCSKTSHTSKVEDVIAAFDYLVAIGGSNCSVSTSTLDEDGKYKRKVELNSTLVLFSLVDGVQETASLCSDVSLAVQWIFTWCNTDGQVAGSAAANGNGDLNVTVVNVDYFN
ncbi:hypothetical protein FB446DRAFT_751519 [Lentinula raphanica]|nr:hypothetical protein C8R42DRAFT_653478 [Lentinula raphanica]KAJ3755905.1 hypothetical protein EV360DRAFT_72458 [Lentinula raphanica]KAJ3768439.1 hypothetical protein FB446DRAFT_751519 [Lentinula raphanica]